MRPVHTIRGYNSAIDALWPKDPVCMTCDALMEPLYAGWNAEMDQANPAVGDDEREAFNAQDPPCQLEYCKRRIGEDQPCLRCPSCCKFVCTLCAAKMPSSFPSNPVVYRDLVEDDEESTGLHST